MNVRVSFCPSGCLVSLHIGCAIHKHASALAHFPRDFARQSILSALSVTLSNHQPQSDSSAYRAATTRHLPSHCPNQLPTSFQTHLIMSQLLVESVDFDITDWIYEDRIDWNLVNPDDLGSPAAASRMQGGEAE